MEKKYPIVILPGWLNSASKYGQLSQKFNQKGFHTHVISFFGFEPGAKLIKTQNLTDYVKQVQKFLKHKKITKAVFIGHSFGGRVALKLLSQEPKKGHALILSGTPGYSNISKLKFYLTIMLAKLGKILSFLPPLIIFRRHFRKLFYKITKADDYYRADGLVKETFKNIIKEPLDDYMQKIRVPTLLLWGEKDKYVPVKIAKKMQKRIKNSQIIIIEKAKHNFIHKEPEKVVNKIISFVT